MGKAKEKQEMLNTLRTKTSVKQDVYDRTFEAFGLFQKLLKETADDYAETVKDDERVIVSYSSESSQHAKLVFGGDTLLFHMHSNVFVFDGNNPVWNQKYLKEDPYRAYSGVIHVYNFLSDSFRYNRVNDLGYLVARIFVNRDGHFFVESKQTEVYNASFFGRSKVSTRSFQRVIESVVRFSLDFELLTPPYEAVQEVSVQVMQDITFSIKRRTAKRLGFKFEAETQSVGNIQKTEENLRKIK